MTRDILTLRITYIFNSDTSRIWREEERGRMKLGWLVQGLISLWVVSRLIGENCCDFLYSAFDLKYSFHYAFVNKNKFTLAIYKYTYTVCKYDVMSLWEKTKLFHVKYESLKTCIKLWAQDKLKRRFTSWIEQRYLL